MPEKQISQRHLSRLKEIKTFINTWRTNEGLSQSEFAGLAETHPNTIYNIERTHSMNIITLFNCIDAMEMSLSEFFTDME
jgi:hypothetical protein